MTAEQRRSVDEGKARFIVMQQILAALRDHTAFPGMKAVIETLLKDAKDPLSDQKRGGNTYVTNNIQVDVAAKDPDRWIAELDAKVARKIRAPSQARGTIDTRGGM
jgi:hypothetical protein